MQDDLGHTCRKGPHTPAIGDGTGSEPIPARHHQGCRAGAGSRTKPIRLKPALADRTMICARVSSGALVSACQSSPGESDWRVSRTTFRGRAAHAPPCGWKYWLFRAVGQVLTTVPHDRHNECPIVSPQFGNPCAEGRRFAGLFGPFRR